VKEITPQEVIVINSAGGKRLPTKQVFALTGYHPDFQFIQSLAVHLDPVTCKPALIRKRSRATFRVFTWRAW